MILANAEIHKALDEGRLVIKPEPSPRIKSEGTECPYNTSSVDLRLGNEIVWLQEGNPISLDLRAGSIAKLVAANSERRTITEAEPYLLRPNHLVLAKTLETVHFPMASGDAPCLAARVEGRSSFARCGVLVHFTAPTIHSGFKGTITLEIINLGKYAVNLYAGMYICQLIIEEVKGNPFENFSQFQGQSRPEGASR